MENWRDNAASEFLSINEKIRILTPYLRDVENGKVVSNLSNMNLKLLFAQQAAMIAYERILQMRLSMDES